MNNCLYLQIPHSNRATLCSNREEVLAFTWACERFSDYLHGLTFRIQTDHKLLVSLFSLKNLDELQVQRFRLRMMQFSFTILHVPRKSLLVADALLRAPCSNPVDEDTLLHQETASLPATEKQLERIRQHQEEDEVCQQVAAYHQSGWPSRQMIAGAARHYFPVAAELSVKNGLLM